MISTAEMERNVRIPQPGGAEDTEIRLYGDEATRFQRLSDNQSVADAPLPEFLATAVSEKFESDEETIKFAQNLTEAQEMVQEYEGTPIFNVNLACMNTAVTSAGSNLFLSKSPHFHSSFELHANVASGITYNLTFEGGSRSRALSSGGKTVEEDNLKLLIPKAVFVDSNSSSAQEAVEMIGKASSGVLAVGEKAVTKFLEAMAKNEYGKNSDRITSAHERSLALLGISGLKTQGADLKLGSKDLVHSVGMDIVARMIVGGINRDTHGYYRKSMPDITRRLPAVDFSSEDSPIIVARAVRLMTESQVYGCLLDLARSNGGSVEEFLRDQANSVLKNLLGVQAPVNS